MLVSHQKLIFLRAAKRSNGTCECGQYVDISAGSCKTRIIALPPMEPIFGRWNIFSATV